MSGGTEAIKELRRLSELYRGEEKRAKREAQELRAQADKKQGEADTWLLAALEAENRADELQRLIPTDGRVKP